MEARVSLAQLYEVIQSRMGADPSESYVASLLERGEDAVLQKIGEEAVEVVLAGKSGDRKQTVHELADLWFHMLIFMARQEISPEEIETELGARSGRSGLERGVE